MGWSGIERDRKALERILALLVALAGLADRVALLPAPIRLPLLAILVRCEAVARCFVLDLAWECGVPAQGALASSLAAGPAGRLSASLRALALVLGALLALAWRLSRPLPGGACPPPGMPGQPQKPGARQGGRRVPAPDTS